MSRGQKILGIFATSHIEFFFNFGQCGDYCKQNLFLKRKVRITELPRSLNPIWGGKKGEFRDWNRCYYKDSYGINKVLLLLNEHGDPSFLFPNLSSYNINN